MSDSVEISNSASEQSEMSAGVVLGIAGGFVMALIIALWWLHKRGFYTFWRCKPHCQRCHKKLDEKLDETVTRDKRWLCVRRRVYLCQPCANGSAV
ncbi:hypothetical protein I317_06584 [Kwoniella heveanensis CBS 569]|uniref:Uncharacterized protein n=1 Tax=Kwoniella heveanensis BCC8398 TaxID=1296120 RepID=A0A1B9GMG4_9TREE|nr:hypothetical protein I316_06097 [Kwoniella heveanensis BCC8398]OCF39619.1 hypothetical protein I317_06584 [Kwoniella heveanensis CBS 569]